jgi:hypothetical protein
MLERTITMNFHECDRLPAEARSAILPREFALQATILRIGRTRAGYQVVLGETEAADPLRWVRLPCFLSNSVVLS